MKLQIVGNCPDCGAPVYGETTQEYTEEEIASPVIQYSCGCYAAMSAPCCVDYVRDMTPFVPEKEGGLSAKVSGIIAAVIILGFAALVFGAIYVTLGI